MSTAIREKLCTSVLRAEAVRLDEDLLLLPGRVFVTREMAYFLVEKGYLPKQYVLRDGILYTGENGTQFFPMIREAYYVLYNANLVEEKTELLGGVVFAKPRQTPAHCYTRHCLSRWLFSLFGMDYIEQRAPINPTTDEMEIHAPEPDVTVLTLSFQTWHDRHPVANETQLVIEIGDVNTQGVDENRTIKAQLYALAETHEYWIADTTTRSIIVHRKPQNGKYQSIVTRTTDQMIACLAKPDQFIKVDELFVPIITKTETNPTPNA